MNKYVFANQLRGIAALTVLISHWFGVYWGMPEAVAWYTASPVQKAVAPDIFFVLKSMPYFSLGPIGVALFFLISGFVIPIALEKIQAIKFLAGRFFRIFPTYWTGVAVCLFAMYCSSQFWGMPVFWNEKTLISNLFLVNNFNGESSIDMVNWTLAIELKFYCLAVLMASGLRKGSIATIFVFSGAVLLFNWCLQDILRMTGVASLKPILNALSTDFLYMQFMLIGCFFYYSIQRKISNFQLMLCVSIQLIIFGITWKHSLLIEQFPDVTWNYFLGCGFFSLAFIFRNRFKTNRCLDWLADISFPLYLIHALTAYVIFNVLLHYEWPLSIIVCLSLILIFGLATVIHHWVEIPTNVFGKKLTSHKLVSKLLKKSN